MKNFTDWRAGLEAWRNCEAVPTWQGFKPDRTTVLQTYSVEEDQQWHLAYYDDGNEPIYWISISDNPKAILEVLAHLSEKTWVEPGNLLTGLLPAIAAVGFAR